MRLLIIFFTILLAVNAIAQTNITVTGETYPNSVEICIHNNSDEDITVNLAVAPQDVNFISPQDVIFPLTEGNTTIKRGEVLVINIEIDFAEYYAYICTVKLGGNFRSTDGLVQRLVLPAKKER